MSRAAPIVLVLAALAGCDSPTAVVEIPIGTVHKLDSGRGPLLIGEGDCGPGSVPAAEIERLFRQLRDSDPVLIASGAAEFDTTGVLGTCRSSLPKSGSADPPDRFAYRSASPTTAARVAAHEVLGHLACFWLQREGRLTPGVDCWTVYDCDKGGTDLLGGALAC